MKSTLFGFLSFFLMIRDSYSNEYDVKLGDKIEMCCKLKFEKADGLGVTSDGIRLKILWNGKTISQDFETFKKKYSDFDIKEKEGTLCLVKPVATLKDDKFLINCNVVKDGLGSTLRSERYTLRVYEELKFNNKLDEILNVKLGESRKIECSASGSPDLQVLWRTENKGKLSSGNSFAILEIKNITIDMNEIKYTCEASTSIPKGQQASIISQTMKLNVLFKPEIDIKTTIVHTDLGTEELFKITVKGNPPPKLDCPLLNVKAERIMSISNPIQFLYVYEMKIEKVTENHIGNYECTVSSDEGTATQQVTLSLKPANIQITSLNETSFSDYYLLTWTMNSKSPINNFTITTETVENGNSTVTHKTISNSEVNSYLKSTGDNWEKNFFYPFNNITSNREYKISLKICNRHECILLKNCVYFRTLVFDGKNKHDGTKLAAAVSPDDPRRTSWNLKPTLLFVITQSTTMLFILLVLQQIY